MKGGRTDDYRKAEYRKGAGQDSNGDRPATCDVKSRGTDKESGEDSVTIAHWAEYKNKRKEKTALGKGSGGWSKQEGRKIRRASGENESGERRQEKWRGARGS